VSSVASHTGCRGGCAGVRQAVADIGVRDAAVTAQEVPAEWTIQAVKDEEVTLPNWMGKG
jgi:hypothetical protein